MSASKSMLLLIPGIVCLIGCGQNPKVDVRPVIENEQVVFEVPWSDANGLLGFTVTNADGDVLWNISLPYEKGHRIIYGVLPTGGNTDATQLIPEDGSAPPDIRGKEVRVTVQYQYDKYVPSAGSFEKVIQVPEK